VDGKRGSLMANVSKRKLDRGAVAVPIGLSSLGLTLGFATGASMTSGTTTSVMVALLGFVAGGLLSYSAYDRGVVATAAELAAAAKPGAGQSPPPKLDDKPRIDPRLAGIGMTVLSLGMLIGLIGGLWFRYTDPFAWTPAAAASTEAPKPGSSDSPKPTAATGKDMSKGDIGLQGSVDARKRCVRIQNNLAKGTYSTGDGAAMALRDLGELVAELQCEP
jgi:hypothetical protein